MSNKMESSWLLLGLLSLLFLVKDGDCKLLCHRCYSAMGGCGDSVMWRMYPWRDCGDSNFCVKVIEKRNDEVHYIRECESELMKSTRHRLQMPVLRRHGYCVNARKNDPYNPLDLTNPDITYCFCNEYWGCNSAGKPTSKLLSIGIFSSLVLLFLQRM